MVAVLDHCWTIKNAVIAGGVQSPHRENRVEWYQHGNRSRCVVNREFHQMTTAVQCGNCGYLAVRNLQTRQLMEMEDDFRKTGCHPLGKDNKLVYQHRPICFRMEKQFIEEASAIDSEFSLDDTTFSEVFHKLLNDNRDCKSFTEWNQGLSPKEHLEMAISEKLLVEQRLWQANETKLAEERHRESIMIANRSVNMATAGALCGAVATLVAGTMAIWPALHDTNAAATGQRSVSATKTEASSASKEPVVP